ncbi:hypothetical protein OB2597_04830 [Pseudooceanicola batsensis HTCC2597]|uniref:Uncharacterized protein n=1 Tax=Pseudooceanicola batsensis (strain ATCC BAA-863 / DSM 15984 / KCTC 12145 / HTCC2597) TaxID=252305 RepID=A3TSF1_PSEBH|nr:hypothetical protein OB2597_04830 [Pseudooceanicola batsensis HTCC2597]
MMAHMQWFIEPGYREGMKATNAICRFPVAAVYYALIDMQPQAA